MPLPINVSLATVFIATEDGEVKTLLDDASDKLAEVVNAIVATGKAGTLTMKVFIKPSAAGALAVRGEVATKKPAALPREALLWATPEGSLITDDPKQVKFDFKTVNVQKTELKSVAA
jgi:hypothetical protein